MTTTLPELTRRIDNAFTHTWYEIRPQAMDNILNATVVWALLNNAGCLKPKVGGEFITRTISYGTQPAVALARGDTLPQGEPELETMAIWTWRTIGSHVQRSLFDDQKNNGPDKIKDLVGTKLKAAKDGMQQKFESALMGAHSTAETGSELQGLNDIVPPLATRTTGTYGRIARPSSYTTDAEGNDQPSGTNAWWGPKYRQGALSSIEDDLLTDMSSLFNAIHNNQSAPNLLLTSKMIFELYEQYAIDQIQIIKSESTFLADLGFTTLLYKGKPLTWIPGMPSGDMMMLNTDFIEVIYDPQFWFQMTDWKPAQLQDHRIAHILAFLNTFTDQPRRHGRLMYA